MIQFPNKKYSVIYADPPWNYRDKASSGKRGAGYKYSLMSQSEIESLPIQDICEPDCVLFLWATMPKLPEILPVIDSWGFSYKTVAFTWVKMNKKAFTLFWGMGNWTRANPELCLLATKGKPKRASAKVHSVVYSRIRSHSQKPDEVRDRIVTLMGDVPRIELFARNTSPDWDVWGNEV